MNTTTPATIRRRLIGRLDDDAMADLRERRDLTVLDALTAVYGPWDTGSEPDAEWAMTLQERVIEVAGYAGMMATSETIVDVAIAAACSTIEEALWSVPAAVLIAGNAQLRADAIAVSAAYN